MPCAHLYLHDNLNDFLPYARRDIRFAHEFDGRVSIKDMIESFGVPHTEIDVLLVNGASVDFDYLVADGDEIVAYPVFAEVAVAPLIRLQPDPLPEARFVLDIHLGRLASHLRTLGFDTLFPENYEDGHLAQISRDEERILLSRDRGLLMRKIVTYGYYVRATNPRNQITEVLRRFDLFGAVMPFKRCARCNGLLEPVDKAVILDRLQHETQQHYDEFRRCESCQQIYWKGTHYQRMRQFIDQIMRDQDR